MSGLMLVAGGSIATWAVVTPGQDPAGVIGGYLIGAGFLLAWLS